MKIAMKRLSCTHCSLLFTTFRTRTPTLQKKHIRDLFLIHWIKGRKKGTMDHIREIQEIIDVHQGGTPTEVARVVMKNT